MPTDQAYADQPTNGPPSGSTGGPPTCNTGVVNGAYGWDWTATTHPVSDGVVDDLLTAMGAQAAEHGKGLQGWSQSIKAYDAGGYSLGSVYFGGGRDDVHVVATSSAADPVRAAVVRMGEVRTARVDTRVDTLLPFEDLVSLCRSAAGQKARLTYVASEQEGQSLGRTLYVGAPTSAVRVRVYEKWLESPGQYVEGTNRVEVQLRPPSRAKVMVSGWTAAETFCASELTRRLAGLLGEQIARPGTLQKTRGTPDLEQTMEAMGRQYGPGVARWLRHSGGDVGTVLDYLIPSSAPESVKVP